MSGQSWAGRLLVAAPGLLDPHFLRTVVLLLQHDADGAVGVVLTRPSDTGIGELLPAWSHLAASPSVAFVGGPVQPDAAICLGRLRAPAGPAVGWAALPDPLLGTLDLERGPREDLAAVRVFAGYAGWSAGQLEDEVADGGWFVVDALPGDAFSPDPDRLWQQVLRRQGPPLAFAATCPLDPGLN